MEPNFAAWTDAPFAGLTVREAPYTEPRAGQILVRNRAVAVNPIDGYKQKLGKIIYGWVKYPLIGGFDLAGEVVAVGPDVTRLKVGDRVLAHATGLEKVRNRPAECAFQLYTVVLAYMAAPIPDAMTFAEAAAMPLAVSTAACGLFEPQHLGLDRPPDGGGKAADKGETVLVWAGSSSVGSNAIQLAVAAGYRVITTASPRNFDYVAGLGAAEVYDYRSQGVAARIVRALEGRTVAGALAIGAGSAAACVDILGACEGPRRVAIATFPLDIDALPDRPGIGTMMTKMLPAMLRANAGLWVKAKRKGVATSTIWGASLMDTDLGPAIYERFLPGALASGAVVAAPPPLVVGDGLDALPAAIERRRAGVSAAKVVVTL